MSNVETWFVFSFLSALLLAVGNILMRIEFARGRDFWDTLIEAMFWGLIVLVPFSVHELSSKHYAITRDQTLLYLIVGLLQFFLSRIAYFKAVELGGASVASTASSASEPILTAFLALLLIHEIISPKLALGAVIAALSMLLLHVESTKSFVGSTTAVLLGMGAGSIAALTAVMLRYLSLAEEMTFPITGVLIGQGAALAAMLFLRGFPWRTFSGFSLWRAVVFAGFSLSLAHVMRFAALGIGGATEVTVVVLSYPAIIVLLGAIIKSASENITPYKVAAVIGVVIANALVVSAG
ncbi:DMT family transporter [Thermococcus sp. LS1]|nr:DMT family transporter [Thermococcus sp. LS1]